MDATAASHHGDPTLVIERARSREVYRTTFTADQRRALFAEQVVSLFSERARRAGGHDARRADAQGSPAAGQRVLDTTGNLKAVPKLLAHSSIQTTGDVYADWDVDQLAATMAEVLTDD